VTATAHPHGKKSDDRRLLLVAAAAIVGFVIIRRLRASSAAPAGTVAVADPSTLPTDATIAGGNTDPNVIQALNGFGAQLNTFQAELDALATTTPQSPGTDTTAPAPAPAASASAAPPAPSSAPPVAPPPAPSPQPVVTQPAAVPAPVIVPTATVLQATVAKPTPAAVYPDVTSKPIAVKVTANKTGASANKTQGVFSIR